MSITTEDANNTMVEMQLSDSTQIIKTHYHLQFLDTKRGKVVSTYDYVVDSAGKSDPQAVPDGVYDIRLVEKKDIVFRQVPILNGKKNIIVGYLKKGRLAFAYKGKRKTRRPVTDFGATVCPAGKPTLAIRQRCVDTGSYPAGNYYIEVISLPPTRYNVDIDWGEETILTLAQPGYAEIVNDKATGSIMFLYKLEKEWVEFHQMKAGEPGGRQKVRMQPGKYEMHWTSKTDKGEEEKHVQHFSVKSNDVTEVKLD